MGIEPTGRKVDLRPNGFEDRGHHQVYKHFLDRLNPFPSTRTLARERSTSTGTLRFKAVLEYKTSAAYIITVVQR